MVSRGVILRKLMRFRCALRRLQQHEQLDQAAFLCNEDLQDIVCHNLQVALQACIDVASHVIADEGWRPPEDLGGLFELLSQHSVISEELARQMVQAGRFRNVLVHEYDGLDLTLVHEAWMARLPDLARFMDSVVRHYQLEGPSDRSS
jgi:uncharacterized protein YutE (UPF0331/DUF86 family)